MPMRRTAKIRYWKQIALLIFLFLGRTCGIPAAEKDENSGVRRELDRYLESLRELPLNLIGREVYRLPKEGLIGSGLSPDGRWLCVQTATNNEQVKWFSITLTNLVEGGRPLRIDPIRRGIIGLSPRAMVFSPDSSEVYVELAYADREGGSEWVSWDLSRGEFTPRAKRRIDELFTYGVNLRPAEVVYSKACPGPPVWSADHVKYENRQAAEKAGVPLWRVPGFLGQRDFGFFLGEDQFFDFLPESLPSQDERGRRVFRLHVFLSGKLVETFACPEPCMPYPILLLYQGADLYAYANLGTTASGEPWKVNLGPVTVERVFYLLPVATPGQGDALLEIKSERDVRYVLLTARSSRPRNQEP